MVFMIPKSAKQKLWPLIVVVIGLSNTNATAYSLFDQQDFVNDHIQNIKVFTNDNQRLSADKWLQQSNKFTLYNLDNLNKLETQLTTLMKSKAIQLYSHSSIERMSKTEQIEAYSIAYYKIQQSPKVQSIIAQIEKASLSHLYLNLYQIKALPAIVINDKTVLYGYHNLHQAIDFFATAKEHK